MAKLKLRASSRLTNIFVPIDKAERKESKAGNIYWVVTVGEYNIIVRDKWVRLTKKEDKYNVGIKGNYAYAIEDTDSEVQGTDLINYYFDLHEEEKASENVKQSVKGAKIEGALTVEEEKAKNKSKK